MGYMIVSLVVKRKIKNVATESPLMLSLFTGLVIIFGGEKRGVVGG